MISEIFEEKWDWEKLAKYALYGRGKRWAIAQLKLVDSGKKTIEQVLKLARRKPNGYKRPDHQIFIGKKGTRYTPERIILALEKKGRYLSLESARNRIYRANLDPTRESMLMEPVGSRKLKQPIRERITSRQQQNQKDLDDMYYGVRSSNEVLGREVKWR